ncbi:MAG: formylmethanofuran dehydrogenase subunit C [Nitrospinae bacterium]|nr:formylmethanofuran dehydrogenase subunit C [Nitrospinota bacterium]
MITLTLKEPLSIPAEADCITPDNLHDKSRDDILRQTVYWGNKKLTIGDLFTVEGERAEHITVVTGECDKVKLIGHKMSRGAIHIKGSAGYNTGSYMTGGTLTIDGNARDYLGAMMEGGVIVLKGDAGHFLGGAYKGETSGMTGGEIFVHGSAGHETGGFMRRGFIVVGGDTGDFPGLFMLAGTLLVLGQAGVRVGANMKRGSVVLTRPPERMLPSFVYNSLLRSPAVNLVMKRASAMGFNVPMNPVFRRYSGDVNTVGKGELLVLEPPQ